MWNYNTDRKNGRKFLYQSLLNSIWLCSIARLAINKKQKYLSLPDHQLAENLILAFFVRKDKKRIKTNL